ncbi:efflux RND transporter periplasmic adaptor subunit [Shewanella indica]|uniref:efflux RND transporter periplasmic adaptor subunit n=1 Tax=Shewanella TaxID=22 RepID=UPI001F41B289|nr:efflux RND transporter periplasmic adaptor subunit [Shewanella indica]MCE9791917.1 efflux RND transporter periplasmic adaptor subunit [Shewanella indica]
MLGLSSPLTVAAEDGHEDEHQALQLSSEQRQLAGIQIQEVSVGGFSLNAFANATLLVDRERTVVLTPQLEVRVLERHVVPGQEVKAGEPLLTLGGAAVAQAQADYINAAAEWSRVSRMSESAVSASRRLQTQVDVSLKRAILKSLQMTDQQIKALESRPQEIGQYQLLAPIDGRVQQDEVRLGQLLGAGSQLLQLTDERSLWVAAELTPAQAEGLSEGSETLVRIGDRSVSASVIGRSHELSNVTRTERVLARLDNTQVRWHAGQFAELFLPDPRSEGVMLPDAALSRSGDGDWQVFIEDDDGFEAKEVQLLASERGMNLVSGIEPGTRVVTAGAFFLASELAKSGFDIHNH